MKTERLALLGFLAGIVSLAVAACGDSATGGTDVAPAEAGAFEASPPVPPKDPVDGASPVDAAPDTTPAVDAGPLLPPVITTIQKIEDAGTPLGIHLGWENPTTNADSVVIERSNCGDITGAYKILVTLPATTFVYDDLTATSPFYQCTYRMQAKRGTALSAYSAEESNIP